MTTRVRDRTIGKTENVVIPKEYELRPVFHLIDDYTDSDRPITACGLKCSTYDPTLRYDHAAAFGRPCKRCFDA